MPIDASQSASASGLESAVAAADPAGDPGLVEGGEMEIQFGGGGGGGGGGGLYLASS